jgi:hypothetical protein
VTLLSAVFLATDGQLTCLLFGYLRAEAPIPCPEFSSRKSCFDAPHLATVKAYSCGMTEGQIAAVHQFRREKAEQVDQLRQNLLLREHEFIPFCRRCGVATTAVLDGDAGDFFRHGWLEKDSTNYDGGPLFHPFRIYPVYQILRTEISSGTVSQAPQRAFDEELTVRRSAGWNAVGGLAHLLEPVYWPRITSHLTFSGDEQSHRARMDEYRKEILRFLQELDCEEWRKLHESLRLDASRLDGNPELYLLLRLSTWEARSKVTGSVSGALWFRHMAEVIRRGFEDAAGVRWLEEDWAIGHWLPDARKHTFGSERPLDDEFRSRPYIAYRFGLFTGSSVRWYMEGDTEFYALDQILPESHKVGIELVNLKGAIAEGK